MAYYTDLFSPSTYEAYERTDRGITGFRKRQESWAKRIQIGDRLICYMTRLSRWVGVLEVTGPMFIDESPRFTIENDPFIVRFPCKPLVWLKPELTVPIREKAVWDRLSFTKGMNPAISTWTGKLRTSLNHIDDEDGKFLEDLLLAQAKNGTVYPVDEDEFRRLVAKPVRRHDKVVDVTVPTDDFQESDLPEEIPENNQRESHRMQGLLANIGERMGFRIWIPRQDRTAVIDAWKPSNSDSVLNVLPLNYDETTLKTIEQIDILWLKGRSIARAFEVEHTTAVYSGILRMADLLALQPNMDIRLHIVAPDARKEKVFTEIRRPVFSLLDRGPLSELCSFISYDSLRELGDLDHLQHTRDSLLDEYAEQPD